MKTRMTRLGLLAAVTVMTTAASMTQASIIFKMTFDANAVQTPGPTPLLVGAGDIIGTPNGAFVKASDGVNPTNYNIVTAGTGALQGGSALAIVAGNQSGVRYTDSSSSLHLGTSAGRMTGWTSEFFVKFGSNISSPIGGGQWQAYPLLSIVAGTGQNAQLRFTSSISGAASILTELLPIVDGNYHHLAAVCSYSNDTTASMYIYVDNVLRASVLNITTTDGVYFNSTNYAIGVGQYEWQTAANGAVFDAAALSNTALAPADFVLQIPEPATLALLACGGLMFAGRRRR